MADRWSLGVLVGLPAAVVAVVGLVLLGRLAFRQARVETFEPGMVRAGGWACLVGALVVVVGTGVLMWPWVGEYHRWHTTSGTVTAISSRFIGSDTKGGGTTQRFVVTLAGVGQRSCDDTRCAEVKVGDHLQLSCKRAWQYTGTPGYDCNFIEDQPR